MFGLWIRFEPGTRTDVFHTIPGRTKPQHMLSAKWRVVRHGQYFELRAW